MRGRVCLGCQPERSEVPVCIGEWGDLHWGFKPLTPGHSPPQWQWWTGHTQVKALKWVDYWCILLPVSFCGE